MRGICSVDDCDLPVVGWGWCSKHYYRWKRHGSTDNPSPSIEERFWAKVIKTKTCWTYTGGLNRGYGQFWMNDVGRGIPAHVYAYRLLVDAPRQRSRRCVPSPDSPRSAMTSRPQDRRRCLAGRTASAP
jgi:hypothetical protein